jgi:hypothetical protein
MADENDDPILPRSYFKPVTFIKDGDWFNVPAGTKWLGNQGGKAVYGSTPVGTPIPVTPDDPNLNIGQPYSGISFGEKKMNWGTPSAYILIEFDFKTAPNPVIYKPLWAHADPRFTQGFGMTLVRNGQCVPFEYDGMIDSEYTYGMWAGYQSPYIGSEHDRDLLTVNATDLEHHAFPHAFCSMDTEPLVISVARWRPLRNEIYLADLWVQPGDLLFVPPKVYSEQYTDMHGNRNSASACWGVPNKLELKTRTMLGDDAVFAAEATKPHYHEEKTHTMHSRPG